MGLLDKLWDDTLAGPRPETGLGKLRKNGSTNFAMANPSVSEAEEGLSMLRERRDSAGYQQSSITIIKPPGYLRSFSMDSPSSAGLSPAISPSSLTPRERGNPWRSNKHNDNVPKSPTVYDWVVISAWER